MINWHGIEDKGFSGISRSFLSHYRDLNITMEEAMLILHILDHAWLGENPFPSAKFLEKRTGKSAQTIRMYLRSLCAKDYLIPVVDNKRNNTYDWNPLMEAIKDIAKIPEDPKARDLKEEPSSNNELKNLIDAGLELASKKAKNRRPVQTKPSHWKKLNKFMEKDPSDYNSHDMELVMAASWKERGWKTPPPRFTKRDLGHAKSLIEQYGAEITCDVIKKVVSDWEFFVSKFNIKGYPSMPIIFGFRNSFFPLIIDGEINAKPNWGSQFNGEAPKKEVGW